MNNKIEENYLEIKRNNSFSTKLPDWLPDWVIPVDLKEEKAKLTKND